MSGVRRSGGRCGNRAQNWFARSESDHGQQPLLDYLPHSAQIARRRRNKNLRALAFHSSGALICLRRTFAHFASGIETLENSRTHVWRVRPPAAMRGQAFIADWSWPYSITLRSCTAILVDFSLGSQARRVLIARCRPRRKPPRPKTPLANPCNPTPHWPQ